MCQRRSGSIPKVNKLTVGAERIVSGLPPSVQGSPSAERLVWTAAEGPVDGRIDRQTEWGVKGWEGGADNQTV